MQMKVTNFINSIKSLAEWKRKLIKNHSGNLHPTKANKYYCLRRKKINIKSDGARIITNTKGTSIVEGTKPNFSTI